MFPPQALRPPNLPMLMIRRALYFVLALTVLALSGPVALAATPTPTPAPAQADLPKVTARAAIVVEYPSGRILYAKNPHQRLPMASTTKTMTALLALQRVSLTDVVTATASDLVGESSMGLVEGEQRTVSDLLYGLLLPSGNDAAEALARHVGEGLKEPADRGPVGRFVALMNQQAQQMGLADTHFMNPHGLDDPDHYSSVYDLASIAWYDLHNPTFNEIVHQVYHTVPGHALKNTNELLTSYDGADGVKTGLTDNAGNCLVASATRDGRRLISVVLHASPFAVPDTEVLLDYGFAQPPAPVTAETLTIARRAQLLWYLADAVPTALPTPRPTATPAPPMDGLLSGLLGAATSPKPAAATGAVSAARSATPAPDPAPWIVSLVALALGALLLVGFTRRRRTPAAVALPATDAGGTQVASTAGPVAPRPANPGKPASKPPPAPPRRVNLLDPDNPTARAQRAIALAYRGQEGSSLAEFLMVVKQNPEFEFGTLDGFYDMPAAGYLALARAYVENDRRRYAAALLKMARETYPDDKALERLAAELDGPAPATPAADPV
ncbi:MAG TPA: D-alanyl-D-alanine carboxypeptidase family protein [Chloroflexia bacterium]|nr:D-alanyl-D-alanine carboxypeptidase family protein [Chloroflexia bacterium]